MKLRLTPAQEALRQELRTFLDAELPPEHEEGAESSEWLEDDEYRWVHAFNQKLGAAGWLVPQWPVEYGGRGLGILEQVIVRDGLLDLILSRSYCAKLPAADREPIIAAVAALYDETARPDGVRLAYRTECFRAGIGDPT